MSGYSAATAQPVAKLLYKPEEAAIALGMGRTAVFALISSGALNSIKIGRRRRIPRQSIEDYIARQIIEGETAP